VNESIARRVADVDKGSVDPWQHIFNNAEIDITNLMLSGRYYQFLNLVISKYGTDAVLLRNNYLLWHSISSKISNLHESPRIDR
jgi:hypothetical protein